MAQVLPDHYGPSIYEHLYRWISYWYQIQAILRANPSTVLEIGPGTGVLTNYLRNRLGIKVTTFDFDSTRNPDVVGDIRNLTDYFDVASFDCVCAFQVLEHIPYHDFEKVLGHLASVSRKHVLLSLPYWGYFIQFRIRLFKVSFAFGIKVTRPFTWHFDGQHYWEIGTRGYPLRRVLNSISTVLQIDRHYFCPDYPYHYFFECRRKAHWQ
jgi:SAM-dependent methyltransferase